MELVEDSGPFGSLEEGGALASSFEPEFTNDALGSTGDASSEHDAPVGRPAPASKRRSKADRGRRGAPAKLAGAVAKLRRLEDEIVAHVASSEQVVRRIESRGVHLEAGYSSRSDFEQRILASTPLIKSMRESLATPEANEAVTPATGNGPAARTRRTKALESIARALTRLRKLDLAIQQAALGARDTLLVIESEKLFEECGYLSFEEFLERALGPSPVLAASVALVEREAVLTPEETEELVDDDALASSGAEEPADLASTFMIEAAPEAVPAAEAAPFAATAAPVISAPPRAGFSPKHLVVSLALCVAATFGGGAAGSWSTITGLTNAATVATAATPSAVPSAHPSTPVSVASNRAPKEKSERAPQAKRSEPLDPLAIPVVVPHARATGPREARR